MWLYVLLGLAVVVVILGAARSAFRRGVRAEVIAYLKEHRARWKVVKEQSDALVLDVDGQEATFNLSRLFLEAAGIPNSNPENRKPLYEQSLAALEEGLAMQHPTLAEHGEKILPRLVQQSFLAQAPSLIRRGLDGTPLHIVYVFDGKHGVSYITQQHLNALGVTTDALHERALGNLRTKVTDEMVRSALAGKVSMVKTGDTFDAARLLAVPSMLGEGESLAAVIPDRDTLALAPVPVDGNWSSLHRLARTNAAPGLLDVPLRVTREGFETVR